MVCVVFESTLCVYMHQCLCVFSCFGTSTGALTWVATLCHHRTVANWIYSAFCTQACCGYTCTECRETLAHTQTPLSHSHYAHSHSQTVQKTPHTWQLCHLLTWAHTNMLQSCTHTHTHATSFPSPCSVALSGQIQCPVKVGRVAVRCVHCFPSSKYSDPFL